MTDKLVASHARMPMKQHKSRSVYMGSVPIIKQFVSLIVALAPTIHHPQWCVGTFFESNGSLGVVATVDRPLIDRKSVV